MFPPRLILFINLSGHLNWRKPVSAWRLAYILKWPNCSEEKDSLEGEACGSEHMLPSGYWWLFSDSKSETLEGN